MRFLPILNFNQASANTDLMRGIYQTAINVLSKYFQEIEISTVSQDFWSNLPDILKLSYRLDLKLSFGTVIDYQSANTLYKHISEYKLTEPIKFFAPAYNPDVEMFCETKNLLYVPGTQDSEIFDPSQKFQIKVFPCANNTPIDFFRILQGPYPELKAHLNRIFLADDSQIAQTGKNIFISSPQDYQNIREEFLSDPRVNLIINEQKIDIKKLTKKIKPHQTLYATGFSKFNQEIFEQLKNIGFNFYATRIFNNLDLAQDLETQMHKELQSHIDLTRS
jgi:2-keto-3-deoxy-6-phosphogluconate aldolase